MARKHEKRVAGTAILQKFLFSKIEIWVVLLVLLIALPCVLLFGWAAQYKATGGPRGGVVGDLLLEIARLPDPVFEWLHSEQDIFQPQRIRFKEFSGFKLLDPAFHDDGILLISSYSAKHEVGIAYLYDIQTQSTLHTWIPPVEKILDLTSYHRRNNTKKNPDITHPLLLANGDIVFTSGEGPLVRIDACGELVWTVDRLFHHTIEISRDGRLYVPIAIATPQDEDSVTTEGHLVSPIRDDGIAEVSMDGWILREQSVKDILERHGYYGLLYGVGRYEVDRIHLNDIQPILGDR